MTLFKTQWHSHIYLISLLCLICSIKFGDSVKTACLKCIEQARIGLFYDNWQSYPGVSTFDDWYEAVQDRTTTCMAAAYCDHNEFEKWLLPSAMTLHSTDEYGNAKAKTAGNQIFNVALNRVTKVTRGVVIRAINGIPKRTNPVSIRAVGASMALMVINSVGKKGMCINESVHAS